MRKESETAEEIVIEDHYSDIVEAEVKFKMSKKVDQDQEWILKNGVFDMLHKVGPALFALQLKKEKEVHDLEEKRLEDGEDEMRSRMMPREEPPTLKSSEVR